MAERPTEKQKGQTFVGALMVKYHHPKDLELDPDIFLPRQAPAKADSSGNIEINTEVLALNSCGIEAAGDIQMIQECLKSLREVDLTSNNLSDWREVYKMTRCMPALEFLNLTANPLSGPVPSDLCSLSFPSVRQLVLNSTGAPWSSVRDLARCFPNVEELHLSLNGYTTVELDGCELRSLTALYFNGNGLAEWGEVAKLGACCPALRTLVMGESTDLTSFGEGGQCRRSFPKLTSLTVSDIAVQDWEHIDTLNHFPALTQLKVQRIPLMETYGEAEGRQLLVARLPNITKLNGSPVTESEREDAERAFIRYYMDRAQEDRPARYAELEAKYGQLDPLVKLDLKPKQTAHVKMTYGDKVQVTDISLKQTVKQFKKACQGFVGLPMTKFRIYHHENELNQGASILRPSDRMMFSINVRDGDEFEFVPS